jgi:hypothetical protein
VRAARAPSASDLAAMAAEAEPAYWRFRHPSALSAASVRGVGEPALIVVEHAESLRRAERKSLRAAREQVGGPPILALHSRD